MKKLLSVIMIITSVFLMTGCGKQTEQENIPKEEQPTVIEDQQIGSLNIHSFSAYFDEDDKQSYVYFEVENTSEEMADVSTITYSLYEGNRLIISVPEDLNGPIEPRDIRVITQSFDLDLDKVNKVTYEIK